LGSTPVVVSQHSTGWPKIGTNFVRENFTKYYRFSKLFYYQKENKISNNTITKILPRLKCVAKLPCEMSIENKTSSEVKRPTLIVTKFFINKPF